MRVSVSTVFLPCSVSCATEGGRAFDRTLGMAKGWPASNSISKFIHSLTFAQPITFETSPLISTKIMEGLQLKAVAGYLQIEIRTSTTF